MPPIETPNQFQEFPLALIKNMIMLATSGFGVVVALAWNEAIKATVATYIDPYLGASSGVISLFIYAVVVTMQLAAVEKRLSLLQKKEDEKEEKAEQKATKKTRKK